MRDELMEKLGRAIDEFSQYQSELAVALDSEPMVVIKELGQWNNRHQKMAASVQFFVEAFIEELERGGYSAQDAGRVAEAIENLKEKESELFEKVSIVRERMVEERNRLREGQNALGKYSLQAKKKHNSAYLSRDA